jgi:hypothetical protein
MANALGTTSFKSHVSNFTLLSYNKTAQMQM